jgi:hypothetical protein
MHLRSRLCRQSHAGRGVLKMKSKTRQVLRGDKRLSGNEHVRREIQSFLHALHSYPDHFVKDPGITFEEHRIGLIRAASTASRRRV